MTGNIFRLGRTRENRDNRNGGYGREAMQRIEATKAREAEAVAAGAYAWMRIERISDNSDFVEGYVVPREDECLNKTITVDGNEYSLGDYEIRAIKRLDKDAL